MDQALSTWWPLFGLRIVTPRVELRPIADDELDELAELVRLGVHDPAVMPFNLPWTDTPEPALQRESLQWIWRGRASWSVDAWSLSFGVWEDGRLVGMQDVEANRFGLFGMIETGSWVSRPQHGRGIGKEMRAAVLHFAFDALGAQRAETSAFDDNAASLGVTRSLGYLPNGEMLVPRRDGAGRQLRFVLPRDVWLERRRSDIEVHGLSEAMTMFERAPKSPATGNS